MDILTAAEIRAVEELENQIGTKFLKLMSLAGEACAKVIMERFPKDCGPVAVVCGKGKNGGDGFVIARRLHNADYDVSIVLAFGEPKAEDAVINYQKALDAGIPVIRSYPDHAFADQIIAKASVVVDAMFGIGFHGAANDEQAYIFDLVSRSKGNVVAIDVPSGVDTDTGAVEGSAVVADLTLTLTCLKPAHVVYPSCEYCGETMVLGIGILEESFACVKPGLMTYSEEDIYDLLPERPRTAHKNDFGHVLAICGSYQMPGAACLSANAALKIGAGLLTAAFPEKAYPAFGAQLFPEAMRVPVPDTEQGQFCTASLPGIFEAMKKANVLILGCGIGQGEEVEKAVAGVLSRAACPVVLDADGLGAVSHNLDLLKTCKGDLILTPHPGEMARLLGCSAAEVEADRKGCAKRFAEAYGVTVLLKGPDTLVAAPKEPAVYVNTTGNQGLAKGGSGDCLSGMIAGLLAQGLSPFQAASLGAYLHGRCAEFVAFQGSLRSLLASDLIGALPRVLERYEY